MPVLGANATSKTKNLIKDLLVTDKFVRFALQTKLNLSDYTVLFRLAFINLEKHLPSNEAVREYKAALLRPDEFDNFLREESDLYDAPLEPK